MNQMIHSIAIKADTGIVKTQAHSREIVTPQRTADTRLVIPTPIIEPVLLWVVETGIPKSSETYNETAPAVSAATPSNGVTLVILVRIVLTILQPPLIVPKAIKKNDANGTQPQ